LVKTKAFFAAPRNFAIPRYQWPQWSLFGANWKKWKLPFQGPPKFQRPINGYPELIKNPGIPKLFRLNPFPERFHQEKFKKDRIKPGFLALKPLGQPSPKY